MSPPPETPLVFDCAGEKLVGIMHPVEGAAAVGVVVVVGGPQYRVGSHRQFVQMARRLAAAGYPALRFDYRGMGDSEGEPRNFEAVDDDIRSAIDCLTAAVPTLRTVVLLGLCDAASANLMYCAEDSRVGGLILLNPWARTERGEAQSYLRHYYLQRLLQKSFWHKVFAGEYELGRSLRDFVDKLRAARRGAAADVDAAGAAPQACFIDRMQAGLARFNGAVLFLISGRDLTAQEFMALSKSSKAWRACMGRANVDAKTMPEADHTTSAPKDLSTASSEMIEWLRKRFAGSGDETSPAAADG